MSTAPETASIVPLKTEKVGKVKSRLLLLRNRHKSLDTNIEVEQQNTRPDSLKVQFMKRMRLRTKDEIEYLSGLMRTLGRPASRNTA